MTNVLTVLFDASMIRGGGKVISRTPNLSILYTAFCSYVHKANWLRISFVFRERSSGHSNSITMI